METVKGSRPRFAMPQYLEVGKIQRDQASIGGVATKGRRDNERDRKTE